MSLHYIFLACHGFRIMDHSIPTPAVVLGGTAAYVGYALLPNRTHIELAELFISTSTYGVSILVGVAVGVYGLFGGIEFAVPAGSDGVSE